MSRMGIAAVLAGVMGLSGCQLLEEASMTPTVNLAKCTPLSEKGTTDYNVTQFSVSVPPSLVVSESDSYHPDVDIVWHGDAPGDRYEQVQAIVADAARRAFKASNGGRPANASIQVDYFHALSNKTRATTGGWHTVNYYITLTDPKTGVVLEPTRLVKTQIDGYGGQRGLDAERRGETQKYRITKNLTSVLQVDVLGICPTPYPVPVPASGAESSGKAVPVLVERI